MGNTLKHFLITFFGLSLWIFVFINFLGWSGLAPSMAIGVDNFNWGADKYFGYTSFLNMLRSFDTLQSGASFFSGAAMFDTIKHIGSVIIGNIPQIISEISHYIDLFKSNNALDFLSVLVQGFKLSFQILQLWLQPIAFGLWCTVLLIQALGFVGEILGILVAAIVGTFNSTIPST